MDSLTYVLGLDIGGTKIATALLTNAGEVIARIELPSDARDREKMYAQVVRSIELLFEKTTVEASDIQAIGVGVPGKVDSDQGIAVFQNNLPWENFPIADRLKESFSIEPIIVENDVVMATFAEWAQVRADDDETFVYMTVSTGISCQTIHRGNIVRGGGFAGEAGLLPVLTTSGINERLEQVSSGPALQRNAAQWEGLMIQTKDVFEAYAKGHPEAVLLIEQMVEGLAQGIYSIVSLIDPHKMVIGGGVFNHQPFLLEKVKDALEAYLIDAQKEVLNRFSLSVLKGDAGIVGAGIRASLETAKIVG